MTTKSQKREKKDREEQKEKKRDKKLSIPWDKKSIIVLVSLFCCLVIFLFVITIDIKGYLVQNNPKWTMTTGFVLSIDEITGMKQTMAGGKIEKVGYKIKYYYMVDSIGYEQEYITGTTQNNLREFINFVRPLDSIEIYYKKKKPNNSYINFNINSDFYKNKK